MEGEEDVERGEYCPQERHKYCDLGLQNQLDIYFTLQVGWKNCYYLWLMSKIKMLLNSNLTFSF